MMKRAFPITAIIILLLASFVIAAGSSTRERNNVNDTASRETRCDDKDTARDRIKCRLDNPATTDDYSTTEEACRGHAKQEACERLYDRSKSCYGLTESSEKKRCFLRESGINFNSKGTFRAAPDESKRNYVVLLLYELQERIERMQKADKITTDQATSLIEKIVEIKRMILAQSPRSEIVVKINEFKKEYRSTIAGMGGAVNTNSTRTNSTNITGNSS